MKNILQFIAKSLLVIMMVSTIIPTIAQTTQTREEIAAQKAEEKLESNRLKLVEIKRDIESADSLFVAGQKMEDESKIMKAEAKDAMKGIEKQFKTDSKPYNKASNSKDRAEAAEAKTSLKELTTKYKADLKVQEDKLKEAEKGLSTSVRLMDKADKKLDMLSKKLKVAEKAYEDSEKAINGKK